MLATGRRHTFAMPIARQLGFDLWLITSNGALTQSMAGDRFHRDLLPASTARKLIAHMDAFRDQCVLTFDIDAPGALVLERADALNLSVSRWMESNRPWIRYVSPIEDALTIDPLQAMFCGPLALMHQAELRLTGSALEGQITTLKTEYPGRDLCLFDVLNYGCSKGHALERWARYRSITKEQVMAIGDNYNDIEMLNFAGVPVVMGNASDAMKQFGYEVTLTNDEAGVAAAVEQVLGIKAVAQA
jgi:hypothetical protein